MDAIDISTIPPLPDLDYTQMIMTAFEELDPNEGLNKTAISSYIESNYPDLPPAHSTLLSNALEMMRHNGQLIFANNTYSKPSTNAQPKRGRGRPPKPKSESESASALASSNLTPARSRGRPPNTKDPLAPQQQIQMKPSTVSSGRPRGRPRKNPVDHAVSAAPVFGVKRGRGRPPKST
ncbi:hypothetical protein RND81_07G046000 [Saponaria officinalis]|uniref:H15 domain-containing protein n=1 Tax=Saponaria officinalis TaxID=3572 RepID=A0AAW1JLW9_SAPOF